MLRRLRVPGKGVAVTLRLIAPLSNDFDEISIELLTGCRCGRCKLKCVEFEVLIGLVRQGKTCAGSSPIGPLHYVDGE